MKAATLCYEQFVKDTNEIGYVLNPHEPCVSNKLVENNQHTLTWHVDDVKASHLNPKVNDEFEEWCESKHGSDMLGHVKVTRGKMAHIASTPNR